MGTKVTQAAHGLVVEAHFENDLEVMRRHKHREMGQIQRLFSDQQHAVRAKGDVLIIVTVISSRHIHTWHILHHILLSGSVIFFRANQFGLPAKASCSPTSWSRTKSLEGMSFLVT